MMEMQKDGIVKPIWFKVPGEKCWTGGTVTLDGKCTYCGCKTDEHSKIKMRGEEDEKENMDIY